MCAVGILAPQAFLVADFLSTLGGLSLIGITDYMFNNENSLLLRGLSLYHGWVPFLLVYLVWTFGFDQRALPAWAILLGSAAGVLLLHAAPKSTSRADARQYQLRMGSERLCCSELGFARRLAHRIDTSFFSSWVRVSTPLRRPLPERRSFGRLLIAIAFPPKINRVCGCSAIEAGGTVAATCRVERAIYFLPLDEATAADLPGVDVRLPFPQQKTGANGTSRPRIWISSGSRS